MTRHTPKLRTMLEELIAIPSVSCVSPEQDMSNTMVAERLGEWLEALDFKVAIEPIQEDEDKVNMIATLGEGPGGLVLAGHLDTVPYDEKLWQSDPFKLTEREDRLYGLGTCDMKGFFALAIAAATRFKAGDFKRPLTILGTADEESGMHGARALAEAGGLEGRYAVVGEPTSLRPVRLHKGIILESIQVVGQSGHSSDPTLGANAIAGMQRVLNALDDYRKNMQQKHRKPAFETPVPTLNFGAIHGGDNPNRICGACELQIDIRTLPGMAIESVRAEMRERARAALDKTPFKLEFKSLFSGIDAFESPADAELVRITERLTDHRAETIAFGTEAPFYQALDMQAVVLGPGSIRQAHQPDEYLAVSMLEPGVEVLGQLINECCVQA